MNHHNLKAWFNQTFRRKTFEAKLVELNMNEQRVEMTWDFPVIAVLTREVIELHRRTGARNFVETTVFDRATMQAYIITVQKHGRPTPSEVTSILRKALEDIREHSTQEAILAVAEEALRKVGY